MPISALRLKNNNISWFTVSKAFFRSKNTLLSLNNNNLHSSAKKLGQAHASGQCGHTSWNKSFIRAKQLLMVVQWKYFFSYLNKLFSNGDWKFSISKYIMLYHGGERFDARAISWLLPGPQGSEIEWSLSPNSQLFEFRTTNCNKFILK